jgi:hypothetical protein
MQYAKAAGNKMIEDARDIQSPAMGVAEVKPFSFEEEGRAEVGGTFGLVTDHLESKLGVFV